MRPRGGPCRRVGKKARCVQRTQNCRQRAGACSRLRGRSRAFAGEAWLCFNLIFTLRRWTESSGFCLIPLERIKKVTFLSSLCLRCWLHIFYWNIIALQFAVLEAAVQRRESAVSILLVSPPSRASPTPPCGSHGAPSRAPREPSLAHAGVSVPRRSHPLGFSARPSPAVSKVHWRHLRLSARPQAGASALLL